MLDDTSRKLLRILYNTRGVPPIEELARMSVRSIRQVKMALRVLAASGYINWDPDKHLDLKIIQAWEARPEEIEVRKWWEHELHPN